MELDHNDHAEFPCVLSELLRRTLSLVEYYGPLEANESDLAELKLALIRTIERLEADGATRHASAKVVELDRAGSPRKGPHGQAIGLIQEGKQPGTKP